MHMGEEVVSKDSINVDFFKKEIIETSNSFAFTKRLFRFVSSFGGI